MVCGLAMVVAAQSGDPFLGTWKLNVAKSTWDPGPPLPTLVSTWEAVGNGEYKQSQDAVDDKGNKSNHQEVRMRFDQKDYPYVGGAGTPTTRSYKRIDARTFEYLVKVNGKVVSTNRVVVAADGKTRTITQTGTDVQGRSFKNVQLWEKQ
jgi:bisphosphoglycerate-dependent phosphoglycerate mutase